MAAPLRRYAFSVEEWHRMGEAGLFDEDARDLHHATPGEMIDVATLDVAGLPGVAIKVSGVLGSTARP